MRPTTSFVANAWIAAQGITRYGTEIPDRKDWGGNTWAQVGAWVGGNPHIHAPIRRPVVQINAWGAREDERPLWTEAEQLAEVLMQACWDRGPALLIPGPAGYTHNAKLMSVVPRTELRRHPGDVDSYAHVSFDAQLYWTAVEK